jgi:hypothetical protein
MVNSKRFLASATGKKLPDWMRKSVVWTDKPTITKVFPELGLKNCREHCKEEIEDFGKGYEVLSKMDIVFSSDGFKGLWDLATMSMRGVSTCRHWKNHDHNKCLPGQITDPNLGIIYMTDGTMTEYGESINKRALVSYGQWGGESFISVGTLYAKTTNIDPYRYINRDPMDIERKIKNMFRGFLRSKTKVMVG